VIIQPSIVRCCHRGPQKRSVKAAYTGKVRVRVGVRVRVRVTIRVGL
jgi:hypothetical protein